MEVGAYGVDPERKVHPEKMKMLKSNLAAQNEEQVLIVGPGFSVA